MNKVYLLIGGNVGDRAHHLENARVKIGATIGEIYHFSSIYETAPWGNQTQDDFLNQVLEVHTDMDPTTLMESCLDIEKEMGRVREGLNQPRTIDIDILYFNQDIVSLETLMIPHPRISKRRFVLIPMQELNGKFIDPLHKKSIDQLLAECEDQLEVGEYLSKHQEKKTVL